MQIMSRVIYNTTDKEAGNGLIQLKRGHGETCNGSVPANPIYGKAPRPEKTTEKNLNNGSGNLRLGIIKVRLGPECSFLSLHRTSAKRASNGFKVYGRAGDCRIDKLEVLVSPLGD